MLFTQCDTTVVSKRLFALREDTYQINKKHIVNSHSVYLRMALQRKHNYVNQIMPSSPRSVLARLRLGNPPLA